MYKNKRRLLLVLFDASVFTVVYFVCAAMLALAVLLPHKEPLSFDTIPQLLGNYAVFLVIVMAMRFVFRCKRIG